MFEYLMIRVNENFILMEFASLDVRTNELLLEKMKANIYPLTIGELGKMGWELVSTIAEHNKVRYMYNFKRGSGK